MEEEDNPFQRTQTVDPEVRAYVYSLVNALGGSSADEEGHYVLGDDALACLRDLKRWLKLYDEKTNRLDVARCLAEAKLVNGDLLPILASWPEDSNDKLKARVALACLELLVPLTWPLETEKEMTANHHRHQPYIQQAQVVYKAGIIGWDTCSILRQAVRVALPSIAMSRGARTARDEGIIKLVLYFIRNVAVIQQIPNLPSQGLEIEVARSKTIEILRKQDVLALLLTICSNVDEDFSLQDVIVLEILFNLIKGIEPRRLWMTEDQRKGQEVSDLKDALINEDGPRKDDRKQAWSRHGRFGTMIWLKRDDNKMSAVSGQDNLRNGQNTLFNMDRSKKWSKPQQRRKDMQHTIYDFDRSTYINTSATEVLRIFVEEFLDSGFNPLFSHLRKAIERESERLLDINYRQFFYTVAWFLEAERYRRQQQQKEHKDQNLTTVYEAEGYGLVAAVLNQETFIMLNRYMQTSYDNKEWQDLNASMKCFTQVLLTVQEMAQSPLEEDQDIADNIQNRIFYEETTHDRIVAVLKGYKDQGFGYLDACTELSHVFLRMLERYSKANVDLQIRSRRRARRKRQEQKQVASESNENDENADQQSENEDNAEVIQVSKERKFDFTRFATKFTSQSSVDTFIAFTTFYRDLTVDQLKRAHRFFYRVAFKQEHAVLLYRVDMIALFYKMIKGPEGLDVSHEMYNDWSELSKQLFKKMFGKLDQRPELLVEMLFSKIGATLHYLEYGREKQTIASTRVPAESEVKPAPGRDLREKIGIVVAALMGDDKTHLVEWVRTQIERAYDERLGWESEAEARKEDILAEAEIGDVGPVVEVVAEKPSYINVRPVDEEVKNAMLKNARLKLLMKLVGFEVLGDDDVLGATWIVPSGLSSQRLGELKTWIEEFKLTPWSSELEDDAAETQLRRVRSTAFAEDEDETRRDAFIDDSEGDDGLEDFMFPDNIRSKSSSKSALDELKKSRRKRKRTESEDVDDDAAEARRKARDEAALERRRKIKSELYIRDSDEEMDDEEREEFFSREEEGRKKQAERVKLAMRLGQSEEAGSRKKRKSVGTDSKRSKKREHDGSRDGNDDGQDSASNDQDLLLAEDEETASSQPEQADGDSALDNGDTPLSSQDPQESVKPTPGVRELQQLRLATGRLDKMNVAVDDDEDPEEAIVPAARRRVRGGFMFDSDSDE